MGGKCSLVLPQEDLTEIEEKTGFTPNQIERLYSRFSNLDRGESGTLSRADFLRIPEIAINPLGERIVEAFFEDNSTDQLNFKQFTQVLACFRPLSDSNRHSSREQKLRFAFKMYDLDNDGAISRSELLAVLHMMVGVSLCDEQMTSIVDRIFQEVDQDGDQMISFNEFCLALEGTEVDQKMSIRFLN